MSSLNAVSGVWHNITGCNDLVSVAPATMASAVRALRVLGRVRVAPRGQLSVPCRAMFSFLWSAASQADRRGHRPKNRRGAVPRTEQPITRARSSNASGCRFLRPGVVARGPLHYHAFARGLLHHMNFRLFHITAWLRSALAPCPGPDKPSTQQSTTDRRHLGRVLLCMELGSTQRSGGAFNLHFQRLQ